MPFHRVVRDVLQIALENSLLARERIAGSAPKERARNADAEREAGTAYGSLSRALETGELNEHAREALAAEIAEHEKLILELRGNLDDIGSYTPSSSLSREQYEQALKRAIRVRRLRWGILSKALER